MSPSTQGDKGVAGPAQQQGTRSPGWRVGGRKARGSQEGWLRRSPGHLLRGRNEDRSGGGPAASVSQSSIPCSTPRRAASSTGRKTLMLEVADNCSQAKEAYWERDSW